MIQLPIMRPLQTPTQESFFLFGARGTGKTTWLESQFIPAQLGQGKIVEYIDLLDPDQEEKYSRRPKLLETELVSKGHRPDWIVIDEIQKLPKLLDLIQRLIQKEKQKFVLTGSSARKLKRGSGNLLAGRALWRSIHPFTSRELDGAFSLETALNWGSLPKAALVQDNDARQDYLKTYIRTYLKEEIIAEQAVRNLEPFRNFLEVAAQVHGKQVNFSRMATEVGVDIKTVQTYFQILEDTYIGFLLPAFHSSVRKGMQQHPKFYFFDLGVKRQLEGTIHSPLVPSTAAYGEAFETWVIHELLRLNEYYRLDYQFSFLRTKHDLEVDLVLKKGKKLILIEIKSTRQVNEVEVGKLNRLAADFPNLTGSYYLSQDSAQITLDRVQCMPWFTFLANACLG